MLGRRITLIGENRDAARAAGMRIPRITAIAFAIAGASFALGGAFLGAFNKGASAQLEGTSTFDVIAAVLVGGTLISGGRGSALRTLAGAIVIATISDLLLLRGFDTGAQILLRACWWSSSCSRTFVASRREGADERAPVGARLRPETVVPVLSFAVVLAAFLLTPVYHDHTAIR